MAGYKRDYEKYKANGGTKSFGSSAQEKGYARRAKFGLFGGSRDIYKAIAKLPKPESVFTLPGHKYTGPYNPLDKQLIYDKDTGKILEIYDKPTGKTDAIAMQHDLDYSMRKHNKKCRNEPDRKMVKALDGVSYNERQWGQFLARNMINTKQKLGIDGSKKETGRKNYLMNWANQSKESSPCGALLSTVLMKFGHQI